MGPSGRRRRRRTVTFHVGAPKCLSTGGQRRRGRSACRALADHVGRQRRSSLTGRGRCSRSGPRSQERPLLLQPAILSDPLRITAAPTDNPGSPETSKVRERGVEPPRPFGHTDLNRARLPFRHSRSPACRASRNRLAQADPALPTGRSCSPGPRTASAGRSPRPEASLLAGVSQESGDSRRCSPCSVRGYR